jgi:hypothetical protein
MRIAFCISTFSTSGKNQSYPKTEGRNYGLPLPLHPPLQSTNHVPTLIPFSDCPSALRPPMRDP